MMDGNTEFVISMNQLATVVSKYHGWRLEWPDGSYVVDYGEIDSEEPVVIHELIRCRDCDSYGRDGYDEHYCYYWDKLREPDAFCSQAVKA